LWRDGRLPIERLVRKYSYKDIAKVKEDIERGECIKAVLTWED
jgi:Zn-dependent alcohol dehydrogenase